MGLILSKRARFVKRFVLPLLLVFTCAMGILFVWSAVVVENPDAWLGINRNASVSGMSTHYG